ncbi:MAG: molybdopterin molybdotransferase MoeA [Reichenbachiella sp.]
MISVDEARKLIFSQVSEWGVEEIPLIESVGRVLAQDIYADRDFPPFDRVTMDGIALCFDSYQKGKRKFKVSGVQLAGEPSKTLADPWSAIEIMTGAILPSECNLVIRYEDLEFSEFKGERWVEILSNDAFEWKNVHRRASDQKKGDLLIEKGAVLTSNIISIIATVGGNVVTVKKMPRVAVIATGDELVDVNETPKDYQIRKSNTATIEAELTKRKVVFESFHLLDDKENLMTSISSILEDFDVLLLSGGVSKGKVDFLPDVLENLGVIKKFHKVRQRPGKPFWFGATSNQKTVFAFPGNPISTMMCFRVYFLEWLDKRIGIYRVSLKAKLMGEVNFKPNLSYFVQVRSEVSETGEIMVYPETGNGSGDLSNLSRSDAFLELPENKTVFISGEKYPYFSFT